MRSICLAFFFVCLSAVAQENLKYQLPPKDIMDLADYVRAPSAQIDSKVEYMLLSYRPTYKSLNDLNQEELRLGGLRINPVTSMPGEVTFINNLIIKKIATLKEIAVAGLPEKPQIAFLTWSPDESKIAFTNTTDKGAELWIVDVASAQAKKLTQDNLNAILGTPFSWSADSKSLVVKVIPKDRKKLIDSKRALPDGPTISVADGSKSQNRTYQDLLKNPIDEQNFETVFTSELFRTDLDGKATLFKPADLYLGGSFSPDGNFYMVSTLSKPFSYVVPYGRFPSKTVVYDKSGTKISEVNNVPLTEIMPKGFMAVRTGKRFMSWRNDKPSTLSYVVALDNGDPANKVDFRDELFSWDAPFDKPALSVAKLAQRFDNVIWGDEHTAVLREEWYDTRSTKTFVIDPSEPAKTPKLLFDRNSQDVYSDPGRFETVKNAFGKYVLALEDNHAFLIGDGFSEKGQFPFIDKINLGTKKSTRLYQSKYTDKKEEIQSIEDFKKGIAMVQIQSAGDYPNTYLRNFKKKNDLKQITFNANPFVSIKDVYKEVIHYKRKDGVALSGTLYLPKGYDRNKKEKLPLLIWAYPEEFKDKSSAGQNQKNPNDFTFPYYGSFVYWVTRGYAVLDDASFPIIGEGTTEPNDTFITQLVDDAAAAIDAVDKLGYIDRKKVAVGGHSYGAFMTANLLTHSDLFACGIARSGAYNRTLTPFGFQSEQRNYWEVPGIYNDMSPFMNAAKMKTPLLLVHGEADNNPGTFTLQTERYFQALKGLGAPVRMVLLPKESHGYAARENILHLLWEQDQFLEKYLKGKN